MPAITEIFISLFIGAVLDTVLWYKNHFPTGTGNSFFFGGGGGHLVDKRD